MNTETSSQTETPVRVQPDGSAIRPHKEQTPLERPTATVTGTENMNNPKPIESETVGGSCAPSPCSAIPREHLLAMLKDAAWYSGGRECYGEHQGYSYDVNEETSLRDVLYRDEPLYKTPEEAIEAHWRRHYSPNAAVWRDNP